MLKLNKDNLLVLTPSGFQPFAGVRKVQSDSFVEIIFTNNRMIQTSLNHRFVHDGGEVFAQDLRVGDFISHESGEIEIKVINIFRNQNIDLYDLVEVGNGDVYYTEGVLSHNCNFSTSGNTLLEPDLLTYYETCGNITEPLERRFFDTNLWIWKPARYDKTYILVADVARGDGKDYSAFHVIDVETLEQVAEYKGIIPTTDYAHLLINIATEYNDALLVVENANVGWAVLQTIIERGYKNLYYTPKGETIDMNQNLANNIDLKDSGVAGFTTSSKTRPLLISKLDAMTREKEVIFHSKRLLTELQTFIWKNGRAEASHGMNDDLVMSYAIALYVRDFALKMLQMGQGLNRKTLDYMGKHSPVYNAKGTSADYGWAMPVGKGTDPESLTWLL